MYQFPPGVNSLPIFGAVWAPVKSKKQDDGLLYTGGIFVGGGGGARRTGVNNRISFYAIEDAPVPCRLVHETDTYPAVCSSMAVDPTVFGARQNGKWILVTGGEDAVIRVWNIDISVENLEIACNVQPILEDETQSPDVKLPEEDEVHTAAKAKRNEPKTPQLPSLDDRKLLRVALDHRLKEHTKSVTCIRWHTPRKLIISSGKDGFVCLWNSHDCTLLSKLATSSGLPPAASSALPRVICRSCAISPSGSTIYTIQSGAKGKAYVTVWNEQLKSGEAASQVASQQIVGMAKASGENSTVMEFLPSKVAVVSDSPVTTSDLRDDGECMAVGNADGKISIWSLNKKKFQKLIEYAAHDLPVTIMAFIPDSLESGTYDLMAASADYKITLINSLAPPHTLAFMTVINGFAYYLWGFLEVMPLILLVGIFPLILLVYFFRLKTINNFGEILY